MESGYVIGLPGEPDCGLVASTWAVADGPAVIMADDNRTGEANSPRGESPFFEIELDARPGEVPERRRVAASIPPARGRRTPVEPDPDDYRAEGYRGDAEDWLLTPMAEPPIEPDDEKSRRAGD